MEGRSEAHGKAVRGSDIQGTVTDATPVVHEEAVEFMGTAIVAYLDILGMSTAMVKTWGAGESDSALHRLLRIKNSIPKLGISIAWDPVTSEVFEQNILITRTLSDSIVTMLPLASFPDNCTARQFSARVFQIMWCLGLIWRQSLNEGFTIRGAVELGEMFWNEKEFTGPALVRAYEIESKFADSSRILIGPELASQIVKFVGTDPGTQFMNQLCISKDKKIIVDPQFVALSGVTDQAVAETMKELLKAAMRNRLEGLQQTAGSSKSKYDEVIKILRTPTEKVVRPDLAAMCSYIEDISVQIHRGEI